MKTTAVAASFAGLIAAAFAAESSTDFTLLAARSASPIHLQEINAYEEGLWIGHETQSSCPVAIPSCPPGNVTALGISGTFLYMDVEVAGGQYVYIDPTTGAVKYTIAHSGNEPEGAITDGWTLEPTDNGYSILSYVDGVAFCAATVDQVSTGPWQLIAGGPSTGENCLGADLIATNYTEFGAWQYN